MTQSNPSSGALRRFWTSRLQPWLSGFLSFLMTLFGLLVFTFILSRAAPIDPALQLVGDHASEATYQQARHQLGLI